MDSADRIDSFIHFISSEAHNVFLSLSTILHWILNFLEILAILIDSVSNLLIRFDLDYYCEVLPIELSSSCQVVARYPPTPHWKSFFNVPDKDFFFRRTFRILSRSSTRLPLMASDGDDSEVSPLLGKTGNGSIDGKIDSVSVDGGLTTDAADTTADIERRPSLDEGRAAQFQGSPEIQEKLKYILPALSIGVSQSDRICFFKWQLVTKSMQILLSAADQTIIVSSYGSIGSELKALNLTSWIATSYFLTLTSFQPLYGKLSDIFGRKACLLYAYAVFGLGCLFCGLSQDIKQLIAARVSPHLDLSAHIWC